MAGGRDPWRGAERPGHLQRPSGRATGRDRLRDAPGHAAGKGQPGTGRRRQGPPSSSSPQQQFDSRSVFVGPADQDPRGHLGGPGAGDHGQAGTWGGRREPGGRHHHAGDSLGDGGRPGRQGPGPPVAGSSVFAAAPPAAARPPAHFGGDGGGGDEWDAEPAGVHRRSWRQRAVLGIGVTVVLACLAGSMLAVWVLRTYNSIDRVEGLELTQVAAGEPVNYLVVGSDSRSGENTGFGDVGGQRSDTIMLLRIDPQTKKAYVLSFPRDLQVAIAGSGQTRKINSAYSGDDPDPQRLIDTLKQNFAVPIHHYVEIDFSGFTKLIDHIGGVPLYFNMAVRNPPGEHDVGLNITELGCVTVQSEQALALARSRSLQYRAPDGWHNDPYGDYGRMTRQQIIIEQALKKAVKQAKSNPLQLTGMIELAADTVSLDPSVTVGDLLDLGEQFKDFSTENLVTFSMPVYTQDEEGKGDPYPDEIKAEPILNVFRGLPTNEVGPTLVTLTVINGSGEEGQAANVAGAFQKIGFEVTEPGTHPEVMPRTTVFHAPGQQAYGLRVARHLSTPADIKEAADLGSGEVRLVTGTDFTTVHEEPVPLDKLPAPTVPAPGGPASSPGTTPATSPVTSAAPSSPPSTAPPPPPTTPQVGHAAGQPPEGTTCG